MLRCAVEQRRRVGSLSRHVTLAGAATDEDAGG
jgi:hypothetical protein